MQACFAAGTPLLTPHGDKPIEFFQVGDVILSRPESDPEGPVDVKIVEEVFVRKAMLCNLHVGDQVIQTTAEHPFWVNGRGWVATRDLSIGDKLASHDGQSMVVDAISETGREATVYNLRISDWHTYFVGSRSWDFSVWAHNSYNEPLSPEMIKRREQQMEQNRKIAVLEKKLSDVKWALKSINGYGKLGPEQIKSKEGFEKQRADLIAQLMELGPGVDIKDVKLKDNGDGVSYGPPRQVKSFDPVTGKTIDEPILLTAESKFESSPLIMNRDGVSFSVPVHGLRSVA